MRLPKLQPRIWGSSTGLNKETVKLLESLYWVDHKYMAMTAATTGVFLAAVFVVTLEEIWTISVPLSIAALAPGLIFWRKAIRENRNLESRLNAELPKDRRLVYRYDLWEKRYLPGIVGVEEAVRLQATQTRTFWGRRFGKYRFGGRFSG